MQVGRNNTRSANKRYVRTIAFVSFGHGRSMKVLLSEGVTGGCCRHIGMQEDDGGKICCGLSETLTRGNRSGD